MNLFDFVFTVLAVMYVIYFAGIVAAAYAFGRESKKRVRECVLWSEFESRYRSHLS